MLDCLKRTLRLHWHDWATLLGYMWGFFAVGVALVVLIVRFAADGTYAEMGTFVAMILGLILLIVRYAVWGKYYFTLPVTMGQTRRAAVGALALQIGVSMTLCVVSVLCFSTIESNLYAALYPTYTNEIAMHDIFPASRLALIGAIGAVALLFMSAIVSRFGRWGWWVVWFAWMFACLILPRMLTHDGEGETSLFFAALDRVMDAMGAWLARIGVLGWIVLGVAALAAGLLAAWRMFMRAEIRD